MKIYNTKNLIILNYSEAVNNIEGARYWIDDLIESDIDYICENEDVENDEIEYYVLSTLNSKGYKIKSFKLNGVEFDYEKCPGGRVYMINNEKILIDGLSLDEYIENINQNIYDDYTIDEIEEIFELAEELACDSISDFYDLDNVVRTAFMDSEYYLEFNKNGDILISEADTGKSLDLEYDDLSDELKELLQVNTRTEIIKKEIIYYTLN